MQREASSGTVSQALEARGVVAGYPSPASAAPAVLDGIDLAVSPGEMVIVIGPNGAGKSTLVRVLSGTLAPRAGRVSLFGEDVADLAREQVARRLAVVDQASEVALGYSVAEVVMMGRAPHQGPLKLPSDADRAIVAEALARADVAHLARRPVAALSGGEQKLVAIARALAQKTDVLLLDEASAHLDVRHTMALYELARREVREHGLACLAVVHDLNVAAAYADRVVLLCKGRIAASGTVAEVMTWKRLKEAFDVDLYVGVNELDDQRYFVPRRSPS